MGNFSPLIDWWQGVQNQKIKSREMARLESSDQAEQQWRNLQAAIQREELTARTDIQRKELERQKEQRAADIAYRNRKDEETNNDRDELRFWNTLNSGMVPVNQDFDVNDPFVKKANTYGAGHLMKPIAVEGPVQPGQVPLEPTRVRFKGTGAQLQHLDDLRWRDRQARLSAAEIAQRGAENDARDRGTRNLILEGQRAQREEMARLRKESTINTWRGQFLPYAKTSMELRQQRRAISDMKSRYDIGTNHAPEDEALLVSWAKSLDPVSAAREGEVARTLAFLGFPNQVGAFVNWATGKGKLPSGMFKVYAEVLERMNAAKERKTVGALKSMYTSSMQNLGVTQDDVFGAELGSAYDAELDAILKPKTTPKGTFRVNLAGK
jgi:hypothetical protein